MHRLHALELAIVIAPLALGCGEGIALDPTSTEPPTHSVRDNDGGDARGVDGPDAAGVDVGSDGGDADDVRAADRSFGDVSAADNVSDGSRDGSVEVRNDASVDVRNDASHDASDVSLDVSNDEAFDVVDASADPPIDLSVDNAVDASADPPIDLSVDIVDGAPGIADASDEVRDGGEDSVGDGASRDAFDGCSTVDCWPAADYYVDASAPAGGDGSKLNPFKTITAAIDAYQASAGVAKKAYVAAGTYDEALGERFPLFLRGLSLEGAGRDRTIIVGVGTLDHAAEGGIFHGSYMATMAVGDRTLPTQLARLSVRPPGPVPTSNVYGVFCDRGNATGEVASPGGQTQIDQIQVGPGYDTAMVATASTLPTITGCEMVMTGSIVTGAWFGLVGRGCDDSGVQAPVTLVLGGEDPSSGNTFSWIQAQGFNAKALRVSDCVMSTSIQNNAFVDSMVGVDTYAELVPPPYPYRQTHVIAKHNTFERLTQNGWLGAGRGPFLDEFSDNRIVGISPGPALPGFGAGTGVGFYLTNAGKVRRNQFIGNDFGLELLLNIDEAGTPADFGTVDDPGGNVFRCNSSQPFSGGDFYLDEAETTWVATIHAAGNAWDHVPPSIQMGDPAPTGIDVSRFNPGAGISFDFGNATLSTAACPDGHVPGP